MEKQQQFLNNPSFLLKFFEGVFKNLVDSNSISKEMHKFVKPVGTRPGIMYKNCKLHN